MFATPPCVGDTYAVFLRYKSPSTKDENKGCYVEKVSVLFPVWAGEEDSMGGTWRPVFLPDAGRRVRVEEGRKPKISHRRPFSPPTRPNPPRRQSEPIPAWPKSTRPAPPSKHDNPTPPAPPHHHRP